MLSKTVQYNGLTYFCLTSRYGGKSIISGKTWEPGTQIYWNTSVKNGFIATEFQNIDLYHNGPVNKDFTYDDSVSRNFVKQFFKKQFDIELIDHSGLFVKTESNEFIQYMNGKYCVDLLGFKDDKIILVEVERSTYKYLFEDNDEPAHILVSKYWKYFHDSDKNVVRYMCFIDSENKKICVIDGKDIKQHRGKYVEHFIGNKVKEFYEIPAKYKQIYDLNITPEDLINACCVEYTCDK